MVVFLLALLFLIVSPAVASEVKVETCRLNLTELLEDGKPGFSVLATFSVDPEGSPTDVEVILGERYVDPGTVEACIRSWKVPVVTVKGVAVWRWLDGCGWQNLTVRVGALTVRLKSPERRCPYLRQPPSERVHLARLAGRSIAAGTIGAANNREEACRCPRSRSIPESRTRAR